MKITLKSVVLLAIAGSLLKSTLAGQEAKHITLRVVERNGAPVENARAVVSFVRGASEDAHIGPTDRQGVFSAEGRPLVGVYLEASKEGYYPARFDTTRSDVLPPGNKIEKVFVLPRVMNPTALYALNLREGSGRSVRIPVQNEWVGYDFERGDLVEPHGKGKTTDIRFMFKNEFNGWNPSPDQMRDLRRGKDSEEVLRRFYGKWEGVLEISFPGEQEGLYEEKEQFLAYSKMKLPHEAPLDGYQPTWRYTANTYSPKTARTNVGFFLRTRVKLDENKKIVSANYAKVVGDFHLDARGDVMLLYYFNPVPNDRNLEFDFRKNLFPADFPGANVGDP